MISSADQRLLNPCIILRNFFGFISIGIKGQHLFYNRKEVDICHKRAVYKDSLPLTQFLFLLPFKPRKPGGGGTKHVEGTGGFLGRNSLNKSPFFGRFFINMGGLSRNWRKIAENRRFPPKFIIKVGRQQVSVIRRGYLSENWVQMSDRWLQHNS